MSLNLKNLSRDIHLKQNLLNLKNFQPSRFSSYSVCTHFTRQAVGVWPTLTDQLSILKNIDSYSIARLPLYSWVDWGSMVRFLLIWPPLLKCCLGTRLSPVKQGVKDNQFITKN